MSSKPTMPLAIVAVTLALGGVAGAEPAATPNRGAIAIVAASSPSVSEVKLWRLDDAVAEAAPAPFAAPILDARAVREALSPEVLRQLAACKVPGCFAPLASALAVERVIVPRVEQGDGTLVLSLELIDLVTASIVARIEGDIIDDANTYLEACTALVRKLAASAAPTPEPVTAAAEPEPTAVAAEPEPTAVAAEPESTAVAAEPAYPVSEIPPGDAPPVIAAEEPPPVTPSPNAPTTPEPGWLGLKHRPPPSPRRARGAAPMSGTLVADVIAEGPAARAGVEIGDLIVEANGRAVVSATQFAELTRDLVSGSTWALTVRRGAEEVRLVIIAEPRPFVAPPVDMPLTGAAPAPVPAPVPVPVPVPTSTPPPAPLPTPPPETATQLAEPAPGFNPGTLLVMVGTGGVAIACGAVVWNDHPPVLGPALVTVGAAWAILGILASIWPPPALAAASRPTGVRTADLDSGLHLLSLSVGATPTGAPNIVALFSF